MKSARERYRYRVQRVRRKIFGTPDRPRLCVHRSLKHFYVQIVDDTRGHTLVSVSTISPEFRNQKVVPNMAAAKKLGRAIAQKAKEKGIGEVVWDRHGRLYHGRVRAMAESAREGGLRF
ncbi:MAG: 50S ribosomal protein L18 [Elusimicrobia bacterium]|nr:50S ribosomal protein L18 [Elusimicrobiota bacterium]